MVSNNCKEKNNIIISNNLRNIREYGSTFYIGIAMVILPHFSPMRKLKFKFSLSVFTQFDFYQTKMGNILKANDI